MLFLSILIFQMFSSRCTTNKILLLLEIKRSSINKNNLFLQSLSLLSEVLDFKRSFIKLSSQFSRPSFESNFLRLEISSQQYFENSTKMRLWLEVNDLVAKNTEKCGPWSRQKICYLFVDLFAEIYR
jgi:hypothetical protein